MVSHLQQSKLLILRPFLFFRQNRAALSHGSPTMRPSHPSPTPKLLSHKCAMLPPRLFLSTSILSMCNLLDVEA